jgi:hypothetical protein
VGHCYGLNLKCFPQRLIDEGLVPNAAVFRTGVWEKWLCHRTLFFISGSIHGWICNLMALLGDGSDLGGEVQLGKWVTEGVPLIGISCPQFLLISLLPGHHEVSNYAQPWYSAIMRCLTTGLKTMEPDNHGLALLKLWASINLSSFKLFLSGICQAMKNWLTQSLFSYEEINSRRGHNCKYNAPKPGALL